MAEELAKLKPQVYKDPRPEEYFDRFHERARTREPDPVYELVRGAHVPLRLDVLPGALHRLRQRAGPPVR